jgi:hypothetical protein
VTGPVGRVRRLRAGFPVWLLLVLLPGCLPGQNPLEPLPPGGRHVLFLGNSLTYTNDLPGTLVALARSGGDTIRTGSVALPNFAVIDHATGLSNAIDVIKLQHWDFVVLQQGPTSQQLFRDTLILGTQLLDPLIRAAGGRSAQLMTWPSSNQQGLFDAVRTSSRLAAQAVGGLFIPAGEAWRAALGEDPGLGLYGGDGFHPAALGTYLVALVVYEAVTGHDAQSLPDRAVVGGLTLATPEATVRMLQRIAHETVLRFPSSASGPASPRREPRSAPEFRGPR